MWISLLKLRDKARKHIFYEIGNVHKASMWYDWWNGNGPLCEIIINDKILEAGISLESNVSDMIINCRWKWPSQWINMFPPLQAINVQVLTNKEDMLFGRLMITKKLSFVSRQCGRILETMKWRFSGKFWYGIIRGIQATCLLFGWQ